MLSPFKKSNDLQSMVATLDDALAVRPISDEADIARRAWFAAIANTKSAVAAFGTAVREGLEGAGRKRAEAEISRLRENEAMCRERFAVVEKRVAADFLASTSKQIDAAAPILEDVVGIVTDMLSALETMQLYALRHRLPAPRLLAEVPAMREATRRMTAALNRRRSD
jgi:hypothetical protein